MHFSKFSTQSNSPLLQSSLRHIRKHTSRSSVILKTFSSKQNLTRTCIQEFFPWPLWFLSSYSTATRVLHLQFPVALQPVNSDTVSIAVVGSASERLMLWAHEAMLLVRLMRFMLWACSCSCSCAIEMGKYNTTQISPIFFSGLHGNWTWSVCRSYRKACRHSVPGYRHTDCMRVLISRFHNNEYS